MKIFRAILLATILLAPGGAFSAWADEGHHHDVTAEELGSVHFSISCTEAVQPAFQRGVALLHSFWYEEAEKTFREIATKDPQCAMAHWGVAMSLYHQLWDHPGEKILKEGHAELQKGAGLHPKTERERDYLAALDKFYGDAKQDHEARAKAYAEAMEKVYQQYPEDKEAAAFYALSLLGSNPPHDTTFVNRKKAAAVLEKLFVEEPNHPGVAHYLIHSYDKPQLAEAGLNAARRYAKIAPASPHALHMPSHIFARLGLWQDDIDSNLASIAATRKSAAMHMGGAGHQIHAMDYLIYAYLQSGREVEVQKQIDEVKALADAPDMHYGGGDERVYALTKFPAIYALELHRWKDAASLTPVKGASSFEEAITSYTRTIGNARGGNVASARKDLLKLQDLAKKDDDVEILRQEAAAWIAHAEGKNDPALVGLRQAADEEDAAGSEQTAIPAREQLAEMLLELKRPQEALAEYEKALKFNPGRFNGLYGAAQAAEAAGKSEQAATYYAQLVKACEGSNSERPELNKARSLVAKK
jgi:tetratricopeptide (TPR) repeat protein